MLVALTGAGGFLGGHVIAALRRAGHRVRALVHVSRSGESIRERVDEMLQGELGDDSTVTALVRGADAVIHLAMDWNALNAGPAENARVNLLGSLDLLDRAREARVQQFLFVSTMDVYHEVLPDRPLDETHPAWPGSIYGAFKAAVELHLKAYHVAYGMNASAWRPGTMYGLRAPTERSLWCELVRQVKSGQLIQTDVSANVAAVDDVAAALALAVGDDAVAGRIFNLVDLHITWQEVAQLAKELCGSTSRIATRPLGPHLNGFDSRRAIELFDRHAHPTALRRGREGVRQYVRLLLATM